MNINSLNITEFANLQFSCDCGKIHKTETKFLSFGENSLSNCKEICNKIIPNANILLVCEKSGYSKHEAVLKENMQKFRVFLFDDDYIANIEDCKELQIYSDIDMVVSFGGSQITDIAKWHAFRSGLKFVSIVGAPDGDAFCSPYARIFDGKILQTLKTKAPEAVICDTNITSDCSYSDAAAGFGSIAARISANFDCKFSHLMCGGIFCECLNDFIENIINTTLENCKNLQFFSKKEISFLCEGLLKCGIAMQLLQDKKGSEGGETHIATALIMQKQKPLLFGEMLFLSLEKLLPVYRLFFFESGKIPNFPPDYSKRSSCFCQNFGGNELVYFKRLLNEKKPDFEAANYILKRNGSKIRSWLGAVEKQLNAAKTIFYSVYPDNGLFSQCFLSTNMLNLAFYVAPDMNEEFTALTLMREFGSLEPVLMN